MGFAAYFTHDVNGGLVRCDVRFEPVVFNGQDVCTGFCNDAQHFYQASGSVQQSYGKLHSSVSGEQALFNDVLYKADVNVSAREQTYNLFSRYIQFSADDCCRRRCTCRLHNLLAALHQLKNGICNLCVGNGHHIIRIFLNQRYGEISR